MIEPPSVPVAAAVKKAEGSAPPVHVDVQEMALEPHLQSFVVYNVASLGREAQAFIPTSFATEVPEPPFMMY